MLPIESSLHRPDRRDARPALRLGALDRARGDAADPPLPARRRRVRGSRRRRRCGRTRPRSTSAATCSPAATCSASRRRRPPTRRARSPSRATRREARDRERRGGARLRARGDRRRRRRPARRVHALRRARAVHAARPAARAGAPRSGSSPTTSRARSSARSARSRATASTSCSSSRGRSRNSPWRYRFDVVLDGHVVRPVGAAGARRDARDGRATCGSSARYAGGGRAVSGSTLFRKLWDAHVVDEQPTARRRCSTSTCTSCTR